MTVKTKEAPAPVAPVAPETKASPLKLSEALRLGSMNTVQAVGAWARKTDEGGVAQMCAISTAWFALTGDDSGAQRTTLKRLLDTAAVNNPVTGRRQTVASAIVSLNDTQKWSRAKIADWLEGLGL